MGTIPEDTQIEIDQENLDNLDTARKWAMFIAIMGFIFLGLLIIMGIIAGTFLSAFSGGKTASGFPEYIALIIFLILAVTYFFPMLYLFRFSKNTAEAVKSFDKNEFSKAIRSLKSYFVYIGILIIVILSFYVVALILAGKSMILPEGMG